MMLVELQRAHLDHCKASRKLVELRGVKDWVHMKTAKMMQDFNCFCNLDVNHKLLLMFLNKVVYLCIQQDN